MSTGSYFMTTFQVRAMHLSESVLASGEGGIALATPRSGMPVMAAQIMAVAEKGVTK